MVLWYSDSGAVMTPLRKSMSHKKTSSASQGRNQGVEKDTKRERREKARRTTPKEAEPETMRC